MFSRTVPPQWEGKRLDRFLFAVCPDRPGADIHRAFKKRDVKVNGIRSREDTPLKAGDLVEAYLPEGSSRPGRTTASADNLSTGSGAGAVHAASGADAAAPKSDADVVPPASGAGGHPGIAVQPPEIAYEDEALLIVVKPQGVAVQETAAGRTGHGDVPFDEQVRTWWRTDHPGSDGAYPALCHRLDRNTGGLLIFAKHGRALADVEAALRAHRIRKLYRALVAGVPVPASAELHAWLEKDATAGRVYIHEAARQGAQPICTRYRVLAREGDAALLEVEIVTGRTHQIRAQLARIGHPILGDSRYGSNAVNRRYHLSRQALWACRLVFAPDAGGCLSAVAGQTIQCGIPDSALPDALRSLVSRFAD